ncbi:hypothetical protein OROGR_006083 [Orobanche gracilis]
MVMAWIWTALLSVVLLIYLLRTLLGPKDKKKFPPGPIALPILGHFHLLGKNPHKDLHRLAQKHGPIMCLRFGFARTVVVSSPDAAELVLKTHDLVFASRPGREAWKHLSYGQRNLVFAPYGPYWRDMRKICTSELLSNLRVNQFQAMRRAELGLLVSSLKRAAENGDTVDLSAMISGLSADMNCLMVFGRKYADRDLDEKGFKASMGEIMELGAKFNLADYFPYIGVLDLQGINRRSKELRRIFDEFLEKIIDEHGDARKKDGTNEDFVDTMMGVMESGEAGYEFDRQNVKAILLDMLIAGTDTSSTAVEWAMSELIRHPPIMKKLQGELASAVSRGHMVEEHHLHNLEYLDFVVKETLRIHPVAPLLLPHESMEDCVIDGFHIPKKSRLLVNVWAIGRDPNVWLDPETFSPERFVGSDIDLRGRDFRLLPFGSGRRSCPGMQVALTVVKLLVAQLVHCFDWELPDGMLPRDLDMSEHFGLATARAEHLRVAPTYRL